jgi:hypothetical protein
MGYLYESQFDAVLVNVQRQEDGAWHFFPVQQGGSNFGGSQSSRLCLIVWMPFHSIFVMSCCEMCVRCLGLLLCLRWFLCFVHNNIYSSRLLFDVDRAKKVRGSTLANKAHPVLVPVGYQYLLLYLVWASEHPYRAGKASALS